MPRFVPKTGAGIAAEPNFGRTQYQSVAPITPNAGGLVLTAFAPSVTLSAQPNVVTLTFSGKTPTPGLSAKPTTASLTLNGKAESVSLSARPGQGTALATGKSPALTQSARIPVRALSLGGFAPVITGAATILDIPVMGMSVTSYPPIVAISTPTYSINDLIVNHTDGIVQLESPRKEVDDELELVAAYLEWYD